MHIDTLNSDLQVSEKESGVRATMSTMGMLDGAHWLSWALPELVLGMLQACLMTAAARAFQFKMVRTEEGWHSAQSIVSITGSALQCG